MKPHLAPIHACDQEFPATQSSISRRPRYTVAICDDETGAVLWFDHVRRSWPPPVDAVEEVSLCQAWRTAKHMTIKIDSLLWVMCMTGAAVYSTVFPGDKQELGVTLLFTVPLEFDSV